jgi:hypothetical protein
MDDKIKATDEERLDYCTTAASAEHARAFNEDAPCDDGRAGNVAPAQQSGSPSSGKNNAELCAKIKALHPEIGECGIDIKVTWNEDKKIWDMTFKKKGHVLTSHMAPEEATACMEGRKSMALDTRIANLQLTIVKPL